MNIYQHLPETVAQIPKHLPTSTNIYHAKHMHLDASASSRCFACVGAMPERFYKAYTPIHRN